MLDHMTHRSDNSGSAEQCNKTKPSTLHEAFCKTVIIPEDLMQEASKSALSIVIAKQNKQLQLRGIFAGR